MQVKLDRNLSHRAVVEFFSLIASPMRKLICRLALVSHSCIHVRLLVSVRARAGSSAVDLCGSLPALAHAVASVPGVAEVRARNIGRSVGLGLGFARAMPLTTRYYGMS